LVFYSSAPAVLSPTPQQKFTEKKNPLQKAKSNSTKNCQEKNQQIEHSIEAKSSFKSETQCFKKNTCEKILHSGKSALLSPSCLVEEVVREGKPDLIATITHVKHFHLHLRRKERGRSLEAA